MVATGSETRKTDAWAEMQPSESIALVSAPRPADDASVVVHTPSLFQYSFTSTGSEQQENAALDSLTTPLSSRPFSPLSSPPKPLPQTPANGGGGGAGIGGRSSTNATGGGAPTGGGGGPGLVNANQFVGVNFGAGDNTVTPPTNQATNPPAPTHAPSPSNGPTVMLSPPVFQTTAAQTPQLRTPVDEMRDPFVSSPSSHSPAPGGNSPMLNPGNGSGHSHGGLSYQDPTIAAVEGQDFSGVIDRFVDADGNSNPKKYSATINWGDGGSSSGTVSGKGGSNGFQVSGSHTYGEEGTYTIQIAVTDTDGSVLNLSSSAQVADAPLSGQSVSYGAPVGTYTDVVGFFTDAYPQAPAADFLASINWGDGSSSGGTVAGQNGLFTVNGRHTYVQAGIYTVTGTVQDSGGSSTTFTSTLYVGVHPPPGSNPLLGQDPAISATEGQQFSGEVATFTDSDGNTDPTKYSATINWGDGTGTSSGTVSGSGGSNGFQVSGTHSYAEEGAFTIQVTINDSDNSQFTVTSTAQVADAALSVVQVSQVSATSGQSFTAQLATFSDADPNGTSSDYSAAIAWGDGQSSAGTISASGSNFVVNGTHTYAQGGTYTVQITIQDAGGSSLTTSMQITVSGITAHGNNLGFVAGTAPLGGSLFTVASFADSDGNTDATKYTATINWGDGSSSAGTVEASSGGGGMPISPLIVGSGFLVMGTHTYAQQGYYQITVSITDSDGATATATSNANVSDASITASSQLPSTAVPSLSFSGEVASFSDKDADTNTGDYTVQINWGDGTTSQGSLTSTGSGNFTVNGYHTYAAAGSYTVKVIITDSDGSTASTSATLTISPSGNLSATGASNLSGTEGTSLNNLTVATFTDSDANTNPLAYSATITWGDGPSSSGSIAYNSSTNSFSVSGSHTYAAAGKYSISVSITDSDGASATAVTSISIAAATLSATGTSLSATAGVPLSAATVATFTDANNSTPVTDFTALIDWGDNTPVTAGAVSGSNGNFTITAGHLYSSAGTYTATITVTDASGSSTSASDTITVSAPASTLSVQTVSATEGTQFSGNVATFTPASGIANDSFVASIGWGDGGVSYGTLTSNGIGGYYVSGSHTYAEETNSNNPETATVTVLDQTSGLIVSTGTTSVSVVDAALTPTGQNVTAWFNQNTGNVVVATFTDANTQAKATDFTAQVNWGDGNQSTATVIPTPGGSAGQFSVLASHTYTTTGSFTVGTSITDVGSANTNVSSTATVAQATTDAVSATEGSSFSGTVASFSGNVADATSATITWGDGNYSSGSISGNGSTINVSGTHTYTDDGVYNVSVSVTMSPGPNLSAGGPAVVADGALTGTALNLSGWVGQPLGMAAEQGTSPVTVATFTDANPNATVSDFTAQIDWGDGSSSTGTVSVNGGGFALQGDHTYVQPGSYTITSTITDKGGLATTVQSAATVGIREGQEYDAVLTLPLPDPVTTAPPTSYNATITWGDGSHSTATATPTYSYTNGQLSGSLLVTATHVYAASGSYTVSATATNPDTNNSSSASQSLTVGDALLNGIPQTLNAVAGNSTGTVTVAEFEDDNASASTSQFTASINWGDNTPASAGTVVAVAGVAGLFMVQGSHSYSSTGSYTITATVNDSGGQNTTITSTATVNNAWSLLSGDGARTNDPSRSGLISLGEATADLNQGALRLSHPLSFDQSGDLMVGGNPALVYNSATVNTRPVIQLQFQSDPNSSDPTPTQYSAQLTFNGVQQAAQNFSVSNYQAGAVYQLAVQAANAVTQTGVYAWSATVTVTLSNNTTATTSASGYVPVVVRTSSAYGSGWGISGIPQLFSIVASGSIPAGVLWVTGSGDSRFFTSNGNGTFSNPEDFGTLVQNNDGSYTYTATDQTQYNFTSSGLLTSVVQPDGLTLSYSYDSNDRLTGASAPDGGSTTLTYDVNSGFLDTISEPGSRTVSLTHDVSGNLTQITDVDNTTRTFSYAMPSNHLLTEDQWSPVDTTFSYDSSSGLLTGLTRGPSASTPIAYTIASAASVGLSTASTGLPYATLTDGNNHTTQYLFDQRGRLLQRINPLGDTTSYHLDSAGDVVLSVDALGRTTYDSYDSGGDLTKGVSADGSTVQYQYDPKFHEVTQTINTLGQVTKSTYDSTTGLQTSITDALGNTTTNVWANGRMQSETDPLGHTQLFRYDADLRQTAAVDALGNWTQTGYDAYGYQPSTTNALGWVTQANYNAKGELLQTIDDDGDVTSQQYNAYGQQISQTNARGFTQTTTYDARGLETAQTDNLGNKTTYQYDAAGNQTSVTDANDNTTKYQYDADNRQTVVTDALGNKTQYTYDNAGNQISVTDADGNVTHNYFDLQGRQALTIDPLGNIQATVCDPLGNTLATINTIGALTRSRYDADNRKVQKYDALGNQTQAEYDPDGNVIAATDGRGETTRFLFNADNRLTAAIDPENNATRSIYNAVGKEEQVIDANGHATNYGYDELQRRNSMTNADSDKTQTVYDMAGNVLETIDANGNVTLNMLDGDNRTTALTDPNGKTSTTQYDAVGNTTAMTDQNGKTTTYQYNSDNERTSITDPNGDQNTTEYDSLGDPLAIYDGNQNGNFSGYDADGKQTGTGQATGSSTQQFYNATGQLAEAIDPDGNVTHYLYDLAGNNVATIDPLGHVSYLAYNQDNQLLKSVDRDGRTIENNYDPAGRLISQIWLAADGSQQNELTYSYDAAGNLTGAGNSYGSYSFTYDPANRVLTQTDPFGFKLSFGYDTNGNVNSVADSAGGTVTSVYDQNNRLQSRRYSDTNGNQLRIDLTYYPNGHLGTETRYADTAGTTVLGKTQYTYDNAGNVTQIEHTNATGTVLLDFSYQYDSGDRLTSETDTVNGTSTTTPYSYDDSHQLTSAGNNNYSYDANGNRNMTGYTDGAGNELQSDGTWNFKYDAEGNLIEKDGLSNGLIWKYTWDDQNQLLTATEYNASTGAVEEQETNFWDVFGNLIEQDQYTASTGTTAVLKFANQIKGLAPGQQGTGGTAPVWADLNSSNQIQTRREYLHTIDAVFASIGSGGTEAWYLIDHLGSLRGLMNNSGTLVDTISYDAFGNVTSESNPANDERYKFAGGQYDSMTGLEQFGERWYYSLDGIWIIQDPKGLGPDSNPYRYVLNYPTNVTDLAGLDWIPPSGSSYSRSGSLYIAPWKIESRWIPLGNIYGIPIGAQGTVSWDALRLSGTFIVFRGGYRGQVTASTALTLNGKIGPHGGFSTNTIYRKAKRFKPLRKLVPYMKFQAFLGGSLTVTVSLQGRASIDVNDRRGLRFLKVAGEGQGQVDAGIRGSISYTFRYMGHTLSLGGYAEGGLRGVLRVGYEITCHNRVCEIDAGGTGTGGIYAKWGADGKHSWLGLGTPGEWAYMLPAIPFGPYHKIFPNPLPWRLGQKI